MDYLPSKNFIKKILAISLVTLGWFYFFGEKNTSKQDLVEDSGGIIVFSRTGNNSSSNMDSVNSWGDLSKEKILENDSLASVTKGLNDNNILSGLERTAVNELNSFKGAKKSDYENYGKGLVAILKPYSTPGLPNEREITMEALSSGNATDLKNVAMMSQLHFVIAGELKKLKVPEEIKFKHLFLLNDIETLSYADQLMVNAFDDTKKGIDAINLYKSTTNRFINSIIDINKFFTEQNIDFSKNEKIKIYINGIQ
ncbi:MAG: hypothetical protein UT05_C0003G0087 [Parcubacteria group bacterium GW2011_GWF2_38_76]|nr:MAG: hypothetical protein UT05_C0003G0087 [Parcubacteria group bacterium GW2011_GWF2_38_76]HBM46140.1 hypothetical protein [Patescibacteria group bacterium]